MAVGLLAETGSQTRRAAEVEVDPHPKMERGRGRGSLPDFFFQDSAHSSIEHKEKNQDHPGVEDTVREESTNKKPKR